MSPRRGRLPKGGRVGLGEPPQDGDASLSLRRGMGVTLPEPIITRTSAVDQGNDGKCSPGFFGEPLTCSGIYSNCQKFFPLVPSPPSGGGGLRVRGGRGKDFWQRLYIRYIHVRAGRLTLRPGSCETAPRPGPPTMGGNPARPRVVVACIKLLTIPQKKLTRLFSQLVFM
jgi:hypothetical protein